MPKWIFQKTSTDQQGDSLLNTDPSASHKQYPLMKYLDFNKGDCCLSDEKSLKYCDECECKEPGKKNVGRTRIRDSSDEEPTTGFTDCGKRLSQRDPTGLGQSNGQSVSTREVILNHIYLTCQCLSFSKKIIFLSGKT